MLQTIVCHNQPDVGMRRQQRPACLCTAAAHRRRRTGFAEQQQRLIARIFRSALSIQYMKRLTLSPVATADDADLDAFFLQARHQCGDNRRFPRPARVDRADHDHRHTPCTQNISGVIWHTPVGPATWGLWRETRLNPRVFFFSEM